MRTTCVTAFVTTSFACSLTACGVEPLTAEEPIGTVQQPVLSYLQNDFTINCTGDGVFRYAIDPSGTMQHTTHMNAGDTLYIAGRSAMEYLAPSPTNAALVGSDLHCAPNVTCANDNDCPFNQQCVNQTCQMVLPKPEYSFIQSRTGVNQYNKTGSVFLEANHQTTAIYTAQVSGDHTCWLVYSCVSTSSSADVKIKKDDTYLWYYNPNQYPGTNFIPSDGDVLINDTSTQTPGGSRVWTAGTQTQSDQEIVVNWSPHLTNCYTATDGQCDCDPIQSHCSATFQGSGSMVDAVYDWRIALYQYNGNTVCNKDFGTWQTNVHCPPNHHHCGFDNLQAVFPIVVGQGSDASCGSASSSRQFKVFTQIRKSSSSGNDIVVHNRTTGMSNFMIYAR